MFMSLNVFRYENTSIANFMAHFHVRSHRWSNLRIAVLESVNHALLFQKKKRTKCATQP